MRVSLLPLLVLASCAHTRASPVADCGPPISGLAPILGPGRMVLLGEFHGSREVPAFAGAVVCEASKRGPVMVALELSPSEAVTAWFAGDDTPQARARVLAEPQWAGAYQDGRTSVAMFELLRYLGELRRAGRPVDLVLFDDASPSQPRDPRMAERLLAERAARPLVTSVVLVGNLHARRKPGGPMTPDQRWMATAFVDAGVPFVSLVARHATGSSWFCSGSGPETCGPEFVGSPEEPLQAGRIELRPSEDGAYDGLFFPALTLTASTPAAFPERQARLENELAQIRRGPRALRALALKAYFAGRFQDCADIYREFAAPTGDDAYSHACCLARAGQKDAALERLLYALGHGVPAADVQNDEDLASLRTDARWPAP